MANTEKMTSKEAGRLETLAEAMPKWDDFVVEEYRNNPEWAKYRVASELEEYAQTGEIKYLLSTLKDVAKAKGWSSLAKEAELSRSSLYETLNGSSRPRIDTLAKILQALGFRMSFVAVDNTEKGSASAKPHWPEAKNKIRNCSSHEVEQLR